eukprot:TRINITY_DN4203_c0_g1_i1.p2 TRINITY_DN4203_c0_g1~~TRINITY_DN4203_c0_g1_i1.p2  ORF type:complete len:107 (+),score=17.55 TRINITY_DN4203_c0_g1_i1:121-441(+)
MCIRDRSKTSVFVGLGGGRVLLDSKTAYPIYVDEYDIQWELEPAHDPYVLVHLTKFFRKEAMNCRDASETWWKRCLRCPGEKPFGSSQPPSEYYSSVGTYDKQGEL